MTPTTSTLAEPKAEGRYHRLSGFSRLVAEIALRPRLPVYLATAVAVVLAWVWLTIVAAGVSAVSVNTIGPASSWINSLGIVATDNALIAFIAKLCTPTFADGINLSVILTTFAMWMAMSLAMMLPSALPMMRTYGDIADVAKGKGEPVVPLAVLVLGYLTTWAVFAALATVVQLALVRLGTVTNLVLPLHGFLAGGILLLAGAYQFSGLKNACLEKCRNPFSVLFGRWTDKTIGVFKLGLEQGIYCVGCCWALMLVMLVVGTMNLAWMAFFTLFTILEKSGRGKTTSHVSGSLLIAWGVGVSALAVLNT